METLKAQTKQHTLERGFTRRHFGRISSLLAAGAALAQLSMTGPLPPDAVKINANENLLGPCKEAAKAIHRLVQGGGRDLYEESFRFAVTLGEQEGLPPDLVLPFSGSSDPLHRAILVFASPQRCFVTGDPCYEAGFRAAEFVGARTIRVSLTADFKHDAKTMAADPNVGVNYNCNPNNPTGTIAPKKDPVLRRWSASLHRHGRRARQPESEENGSRAPEDRPRHA